MTGPGSVLHVDGVLLVGRAIEDARQAVRAAQRFRHLNGLPESAAFARLADTLTAAAAGHTDHPSGPEPHPEAVTSTTAPAADWLTVDQAARLLGCSTRHARRLAPQLGGRRSGGVWHLDPQAVNEHLEGTTR